MALHETDGRIALAAAHTVAACIACGRRYAKQLENGVARVEATLPRMSELALGGTAVLCIDWPMYSELALGCYV